MVKQRANLWSAWGDAEYELVYVRLQNEWNTIWQNNYAFLTWQEPDNEVTAEFAVTGNGRFGNIVHFNKLSNTGHLICLEQVRFGFLQVT